MAITNYLGYVCLACGQALIAHRIMHLRIDALMIARMRNCVYACEQVCLTHTYSLARDDSDEWSHTYGLARDDSNE